MVTVQQKPITLTEFEQIPNPADGSKRELVLGEVIVMPLPGFSSLVADFFG